MLRQFRRTFLKGLAAVLPIIVTLYVVWWLIRGAESVLGGAMRWALPDAWYFPGFGVVAAVGVIFGAGMLLNTLEFRHLLEWLEAQIKRIPLVKSLYGAVRDLMDFVTRARSDRELTHTVLVNVTAEMQLVGFVTRETLHDLFDGKAGDRVAVYLPMSYQIGGYMILVPRAWIEPVQLDAEDALKLILTAAMSNSTVEAAAQPDDEDDGTIRRRDRSD